MGAPRKFDETQVQVVAVLTAQGLRQDRIAELLGTNQSAISRAVKRAREKNWLRDVVRCTLPPQRRGELHQLAYSEGLLERLQEVQPADRRHLKELWIIDVGKLGRRRGRTALFERLDVFGRQAARHLAEHVLPDLKSVGISAGLTLRFVMAGLEKYTGLRADNPILCFPVSGDPPEAVADHLRAASTLTATFDKYINGTSNHIINFTRVCAAIPASFADDPEQLATLHRYFQLEPGWVEVFGDDEHEGLIDEAQALLTSAGSDHLKEDPWIKSSAQAARIAPTTLVQHTFGNLGGTFLPRPGIPGKAAEDVAKVNRQWTGVKPEHFFECARKATRSRKRPGVILVVSGRKADVVIESVRLGLASMLIVDQALAQDIAKALSRRSG